MKRHPKKSLLVWLLTAVMLLSLLPTAALAADSEDAGSNLTNTTSVFLNVTYGQTEARSILEQINAFRTGEDAWAWDSSNTTQVAYSGLGELTYSYELEAAAMQRAVEIALNFSHTRTDGTSCFTVGDSYGENIAAGYTSASAVFEGWLEADADYSGQGHRRNMLGNYTAVGIAHVVYNGVHYWVQEFGYTAEASDPGANDSATTVSVQVDTDLLTELSVEPAVSSLTLTLGSSTQAPDVLVTLQFANAWPARTSTVSAEQVTWVVGDSDVASLENDVLTGLDPGTTTLSALVLGQTVSIQAVVTSFLFDDVQNTGASYYIPVYWAYDNGITKGTSDTTFSPSKSCTRGQFVTFLWRLAGQPIVSTDNPFTDVTDTSASYYYAVLWAVKNGVTKGTSETTFSPSQTITRAQAVTFLYRYAGEPAVSASSSFTDVTNTSAFYYDAVQWAVANGITNGTGDGSTFSPSNPCTRGQMVTFLYRYAVEPLSTT